MYYDRDLYATRTATLKKIAEKEGATSKIAQIQATVFSVAGEIITNERDAYIIAIEHTRHMKTKKGGKAV